MTSSPDFPLEDDPEDVPTDPALPYIDGDRVEPPSDDVDLDDPFAIIAPEEPEEEPVDPNVTPELDF